jgi:hypothetical protein
MPLRISSPYPMGNPSYHGIKPSTIQRQATQRNDTSHQRHEGLEGKKGLKE